MRNGRNNRFSDVTGLIRKIYGANADPEETVNSLSLLCTDMDFCFLGVEGSILGFTERELNKFTISANQSKCKRTRASYPTETALPPHVALFSGKGKNGSQAQ